MNDLLKIENLTVKFNKKPALENVYLEISEAEIISVVGPNGGGKTTLLKVIIGLLKDYEGTVKILGKDPGELRNGEVGYVPQYETTDLNFPVSVNDVVMMGRVPGLGLFKSPNKIDQSVVNQYLELLKISDLKNKPIGSLSGGQRQRVLIARALAGNPRLLVLDEPSTGLDVVSQEGFYSILQELKTSLNMSILMVSHDIGVVSGFVDKIACLNRHIHYHGVADETIPIGVFEKTFGKHVQVLVHNKECMSCQENEPHA